MPGIVLNRRKTNEKKRLNLYPQGSLIKWRTTQLVIISVVNAITDIFIRYYTSKEEDQLAVLASITSIL